MVGCWGVVQPVGHLTVNEDGEGSNPSAPANLTDFTATYFLFFEQNARLSVGVVFALPPELHRLRAKHWQHRNGNCGVHRVPNPKDCWPWFVCGRDRAS